MFPVLIIIERPEIGRPRLPRRFGLRVMFIAIALLAALLALICYTAR
jgi:hypothetical protein